MWIQKLGMVKAADKNLGWKLKSRDKIKMWTNLKQERKEFKRVRPKGLCLCKVEKLSHLLWWGVF